MLFSDFIFQLCNCRSNNNIPINRDFHSAVRSATKWRTVKWRNRTSSSSACPASCVSTPPSSCRRPLAAGSGTASTASSAAGRGWPASPIWNRGPTSRRHCCLIFSRWRATRSLRPTADSSTNYYRWSSPTSCRDCARCRPLEPAARSPGWRASWRSV